MPPENDRMRVASGSQDKHSSCLRHSHYTFFWEGERQEEREPRQAQLLPSALAGNGVRTGSASPRRLGCASWRNGERASFRGTGNAQARLRLGDSAAPCGAMESERAFAGQRTRKSHWGTRDERVRVIRVPVAPFSQETKAKKHTSRH